MVAEVAGLDASIWRDVFWHYRHAHVPRVHGLRIPAGRFSAREKTEARRHRDQRIVLALRRSGLDVRVPDDLSAVDRCDQITRRA